MQIVNKTVSLNKIETGYKLRFSWEESGEYKNDWKDQEWSFNLLKDALVFIEGNQDKFLKEEI